MREYAIPFDAKTVEALRHLRRGVFGIAIVDGRNPVVDGFRRCFLKLDDGQFVQLTATQVDLEFKFEVFPIAACVVATCAENTDTKFRLDTPVTISLLQTEEWLDPDIECKDAVGTNPIAQCRGLPGSAPNRAIAACRYIGGIELRENGGASLTIATTDWPLSIHVSGFRRSGTFCRDAYSSHPLP
jgi:hypothetical protein